MMAEIVFECFALEKAHNQIPSPMLLKMIKNARQVWMLQAGQHGRFLFEGISRLLQLLSIHPALPHLFQSDQAIAKQGVLSLVDCAHTAAANKLDNPIALLY
jgi:hypothetical protein